MSDSVTGSICHSWRCRSRTRRASLAWPSNVRCSGWMSSSIPQRTDGTARSTRAVRPFDARTSLAWVSIGIPLARSASASSTSGCDSLGAAPSRRSRLRRNSPLPGRAGCPSRRSIATSSCVVTFRSCSSCWRTERWSSGRRSAARSNARRTHEANAMPSARQTRSVALQRGRLAEADSEVWRHPRAVPDREVQRGVRGHASQTDELSRGRTRDEPAGVCRTERRTPLLERCTRRRHHEDALVDTAEHSALEQANLSLATDTVLPQLLGRDHAVVSCQPGEGSRGELGHRQPPQRVGARGSRHGERTEWVRALTFGVFLRPIRYGKPRVM